MRGNDQKDVKYRGLLGCRSFATTGLLPSSMELDSVMHFDTVKSLIRDVTADEGSDVLMMLSLRWSRGGISQQK